MVDFNSKPRVFSITKLFFQNCKLYFKEFCLCTSIHGFRYFEERRTFFERIWWFFILVVSVAACVLSVNEVYKKWEQNAIVINFANKPTSVFNIPFPAVTVCLESKIRKDKINFTELLTNLEESVERNDSATIDDFEYLSTLCSELPPEFLNASKAYLKVAERREPEDFSENFYKFMDDLKPKYHIHKCKVLGTYCNTMLRSIITNEGICYTFNILSRNDIFRKDVVHYKDFHSYSSSLWTVEKGYPQGSLHVAHPKRIYLTGVKNGFHLKLSASSKDLDFGCKGEEQGYKVLLHNPMSIPDFNQGYIRLPLNQSVVISVTPTLITTSPSLETYNAKSRDCYFQSEKQLKYFQLYTQNNCKLECYTNYTLHFCNCVKFFMPKINGTKICSKFDGRCTRYVDRIIFLSEAMSEVETNNPQNERDILAFKLFLNIYSKRLHKKPLKHKCKCLPPCSDLNYRTEISQNILNVDKWLSTERPHVSFLTVYFKHDHFFQSQRNELYAPIDFVANFGGLLGLFSGFSMISVIEVLYFLTVRLFCNKFLFGRWVSYEEKPVIK